MKLNIRQFFPHDHRPAHIKSLDGLRGLAVLLVILSHAERSNILIIPFSIMSGSGKIGVVVFFVLSAYLLDWQIATKLRANQADKHYWLNYTLRRGLRILPLFFLSALIVISFQSNGTGVYWSIPVELKYYLISPLLLVGFDRILKWKFKSMLLSLIALIGLSISVGFFMDWSTTSTSPYLYVFLSGTLIALWQIMYPKQVEKLFNSSSVNWVWPILLLAGVIFFPEIFDSIFGQKLPEHQLTSRILWTVISCYSILASQYKKHGLRWLLETRFMRFIGNISFSIYLFHMPVLDVVSEMWFVPESLKGVTAFAAIVCFSSITYRMVEYPLSKVRLKRKELVVT